MRGISITDVDQRRMLMVELAEILDAIGDAARQSCWKLSGVETLGGDAAEELQRLSDEHRTVEGTHLARLAACTSQIIDGEFQAFHGTAESPWLVIYAVDSSAYDVMTDDDDTLLRLRTRFQMVRELADS